MLVFQNKVFELSTIYCSGIVSLVCFATLVKVRLGSRSLFATWIALLCCLYNVSQVAQMIFGTIELTDNVCGEYETNLYKYFYLTTCFGLMFNLHYLLFAVKYLWAGIESLWMFDLSPWVYHAFTLIVYSVYIACTVPIEVYAFSHYPQWRPTTKSACDNIIKYSDYIKSVRDF